jgi:hypothetical protein
VLVAAERGKPAVAEVYVLSALASDNRAAALLWQVGLDDVKRLVGEHHPRDQPRPLTRSSRRCQPGRRWMIHLIFNCVVNNLTDGQGSIRVRHPGGRQPAPCHRFNRDIPEICAHNRAAEPEGITALGNADDFSEVACDSFIVAGMTDHLTRWSSPTEHQGSRWPAILGVAHSRSREEKGAPKTLGSRAHPSIGPAAGQLYPRAPKEGTSCMPPYANTKWAQARLGI